MATWFVVVGFLLLVSGFVLRTIIMMRSSDAAAPVGHMPHGRELLRQYSRQFPKDPMPLLMRGLLLSGALLLLVGISYEISR